MLARPQFWIALAAVTTTFGCGVRQFNADPAGGASRGPSSPTGGETLFNSYGPHYASGQEGQLVAVANPATGCRSSAGRPCVRARASIGVPYQFDQNSAADRHPDNGGAGGAGALVTTAGAGKTTVSAGPNAPNHPRMENRDLHIMQRQAAPGEERF